VLVSRSGTGPGVALIVESIGPTCFYLLGESRSATASRPLLRVLDTVQPRNGCHHWHRPPPGPPYTPWSRISLSMPLACSACGHMGAGTAPQSSCCAVVDSDTAHHLAAPSRDSTVRAPWSRHAGPRHAAPRHGVGPPWCRHRSRNLGLPPATRGAWRHAPIAHGWREAQQVEAVRVKVGEGVTPRAHQPSHSPRRLVERADGGDGGAPAATAATAPVARRGRAPLGATPSAPGGGFRSTHGRRQRRGGEAGEGGRRLDGDDLEGGTSPAGRMGATGRERPNSPAGRPPRRPNGVPHFCPAPDSGAWSFSRTVDGARDAGQ